MIRILLTIVLAVATAKAQAESLTTVRAVRPMSIISSEDIGVLKVDVPGALSTDFDIAGLEARITLYPGRPIRPGDVGPPALVERNSFVPLVYERGGLLIVAEGRSLGRAAVGEWVRVMNVSSRSTVSGRVSNDGRVFVSSGNR